MPDIMPDINPVYEELGPPVTPIPSQDDYNMIIRELRAQYWTNDEGDHDWGDGRRPALFRQYGNTDYRPVRKPNGRWVLLSRARNYLDIPRQHDRNNIGQGGQKRHRQKKQKITKKNNKLSRKRRRTRRHK